MRAGALGHLDTLDSEFAGTMAALYMYIGPPRHCGGPHVGFHAGAMTV